MDETANVINGPMIELLNGLEAGIRVTAAMQTVSDLAARLGSDSRARMALGNFNNLIALRSKDRLTQEFICETFGKTTVWSTSACSPHRPTALPFRLSRLRHAQHSGAA
ncbi:MAG: TraM recognition domain-containing protein [Sutterella wadsworthensis]